MINGLNIQITVNAPGVAQTTASVSQGLNQVATAARVATESTKDLKKEFVQVAGAFTSLMVGKQVLGVIGAFAEKADAITTGMAKIRSVTQLQASEEVTLKNTVMSVAEATGNSFKDVAEASKNLLAQSLNPAQVEAVLGPLFKLSKVGDLGVESATNLVVSLGNLGIVGKEISPAFDVMLNLSNKSSLAVKDFVEVLTKAGPAAARLHIDFKDLAQTAALLRRGFSSGAEEGTSLANALTAMTNPKKLKALKDAFGIDIIDQSTGRTKKLMQIWQELSLKVKDNAKDQGLLGQIFGSRTGARVMATAAGAFQIGMQFGDSFKKGADLAIAMSSESNNSGGALEKSFSERMMTMGEAVNQLKSALDNLLGVLGTGMAATLTTLITGLTSVITSIREWLMANPALANTLSTVLGYVAQFAAGFGIFMMFFGGIKLVAFGITFLSSSMGALKLSMAAIPAMFKGIAVEGALSLSILKLGFTSLRGAIAMTRVLVGGLMRALLGPFGIILLLFDVIPFLAKLLGMGDNSADKAKSTAETMKLSADAMNSTSNNLNDAASQLALFAEKLQESIAMYSSAFMKKPMVIDPNQAKFGMQVATEFSKRTNTPIEEILPFVNALQEESEAAKMAAASGGKFVVPANISERALIAHRVLGGEASILSAMGVTGAAKLHKFFEDTTHNRETGASVPNTMNAQTQRLMDQGFDVTGLFGRGLNEGVSDVSAADLFRQKGVNVPMLTPTPSTAAPSRRDMTHGSDEVKAGTSSGPKNLLLDTAQFKNVQFMAPVKVQIGNEADITAAIKAADDHAAAHGFGGQ